MKCSSFGISRVTLGLIACSHIFYQFFHVSLLCNMFSNKKMELWLVFYRRPRNHLKSNNELTFSPLQHQKSDRGKLNFRTFFFWTILIRTLDKLFIFLILRKPSEIILHMKLQYTFHWFSINRKIIMIITIYYCRKVKHLAVVRIRYVYAVYHYYNTCMKMKCRWCAMCNNDDYYYFILMMLLSRLKRSSQKHHDDTKNWK